MSMFYRLLMSHVWCNFWSSSDFSMRLDTPVVFKNDQILRFSVELTGAFRFRSFRCEEGSQWRYEGNPSYTTTEVCHGKFLWGLWGESLILAFAYPCSKDLRLYQLLRMGMLGIADSSTGQKDWHNILGGVEYLNLKTRDASSMPCLPISLLPNMF